MAELDLRHHSSEPFTLADWQDRQQSAAPTTKPSGLWVSVDDDWRRWCEGEEFGLGQREYVVTLAPGAQLLRLETVRDLDEFTAEWGVDLGRSMRSMYIAWAAVAAGYQGIIIAPYQWGRRFDLFWYYGWDCASGCIWDRDALADVALSSEAPVNSVHSPAAGGAR